MTTQEDSIQQIEAALAEAVGAFCRFPNKLDLRATSSGSKLIVALKPDKNDYGRINGAQGVMYAALETVVKCLGLSAGFDAAILDLDEPDEGGESLPPLKFRPNGQWSPDDLERIATLLFALMAEGQPFRFAFDRVSSTLQKMTLVMDKPPRWLDGNRRQLADLEAALNSLFGKIARPQGMKVEFSMSFEQAWEVRR